MRELLLEAFTAALEAVDAYALVRAEPLIDTERLTVVGAGKAAAAMAAAVEAACPPQVQLDGVVITRHGHGLPTTRIRVVEAGHPLPDGHGLAAARELLRVVSNCPPQGQILALISGGGSSLLTLPAWGLELADVVAVTRALLASGTPIAEVNCVRKHLSLTLGGRLAALARAPVTVWAISDVVGDDPAVIASGPFAPDPTTYAEALAVLERWRIDAPAAVRQHLERGARGELPETPKPGEACFARVEHRILASGRMALEAAARFFRSRGIEAVVLGDAIEGEAREVAAVFAAIAREVRLYGTPWTAPVALVSGGETTVTVRGRGQGGRNAEFALALALRLQGIGGVYALAADTDGIDGTGPQAGAIVTPNTLERAAAMGLDARRMLEDNDAGGFFAALGDDLRTGPTRTNVNDFRLVLILPG